MCDPGESAVIAVRVWECQLSHSTMSNLVLLYCLLTWSINMAVEGMSWLGEGLHPYFLSLRLHA